MNDHDIKSYLLGLDKPVPRYTSYPAAPQFKPLAPSDTQVENWLSSLDRDEPLSVYIHIPYCAKLCWYCGCNTKITRQYHPVETYLDYLKKEILLFSAKWSEERKPKIAHLHFGGGSPGLLKASDFDAFMQFLKTHFTFEKSAELAIELDPRNVTEAKIATYAKHGINRLSFGVQDFDARVLKAINRPQPFRYTHNASTLARHYGIDKISIDLLYGLPHQTLERFQKTIETALILKPDRISLFGYAHVPWVKKHMRLIDDKTLPDASLRYDLFQQASHYFQDAGYRAIGLDHFALPDDPMTKALDSGQLHRNFQGYTPDPCQNLIGFGASAISQLKQGFAQNAPDLPSYKKALDQEKLPYIKACKKDKRDTIKSRIIEQLMCYYRVNLGEIIKNFDLDADYFSPEIRALQPFIEAGYITYHAATKQLEIERSAYPLVRLIASLFDDYYQAHQPLKRHSRAV